MNYRKMYNVQGSEVLIDVIKFDDVFIIATLNSIINLQGNDNLGQCFSILTKHYGHLRHKTKTKTKISYND